MKKYIILLLIFFAITGYAQTTNNVKLDEKSIVKDKSGNVVPYVIWKAYIKTGDYAISYKKESNDFLIYEMTEQQKAKSIEVRNATMAKSPRPMLSKSFKDGEKFKGEKFTDINGVKYDLKQLTGKVLVFNFWFINCPPCRQEIPDLNEVYSKYKDNKDVIFLAIALDDKYSIKQFLKTTPFLYPIVSEGGFYAKKYNVSSYPTHLVVGNDGLVKFHTTGLGSNTIYWVEKTIKEQIGI